MVHEHKRLRCVSVIDSLWVGGTERSLVEQSVGLVDLGVDTTIVCLRRRDRGVHEEALRRGIPVGVLPSTSLPLQVRELRSLVRSLSPDVVHCSLLRASLVARLACVGSKVPLLNSIVNTPYVAVRFRDPAITPWKLHLIRIVDRLTAPLVTHWHAVSGEAARSAIEHLRIPEQKVTVIRRTRDRQRLGERSGERREAARRRLGLSPDAPVLLAVGREDFQKNHVALVRAMSDVVRSRPGAVLLIAGREGTESERIVQTIGQLELESSVVRLGHRTDVPELYTAADLYLTAAHWEGFSGALLEARLSGLPTLARALPQNHEIPSRGEPLDRTVREVNGLEVLRSLEETAAVSPAELTCPDPMETMQEFAQLLLDLAGRGEP
ncbi:MAG: glycosyltransferase [Acidobacteria bacterium]|nr:MAG: glycosyltransferase [Acidobacteriota bacterium]REK04376.1 MAG: glycosyltransferase [Acidobacteriota bacterium]